MAPSPHRVLIVSASIGGGHVAAGNALTAAFSERNIETEHVDLLDYTAAPFRRLYRQAYFDLVRTAPDLVEWLGRRMDQMPREAQTRQQRLRARLTRLLSYELPRELARIQPDLVVHTHFLGPEILSGTRRHLSGPPQVEVITDFFAHSLWLKPVVQRYFVATDEVAVHLRSAGVDDARIRVTGIPIDLRFTDLPEAAVARAAAGVPVDRDMVLVMAGGLEERALVTLLNQLRELPWPVTVMVVCGRSEALVKTARNTVAEHEGPVRFEVRSFSEDVPVLMAAADILVGKPGGLTSSEALAASLPIAIVHPYPLQEEANANVLLEHGAAMRIEPLSTLRHKLLGFFEDEQRRAAMQAACRRLAKPDAARAVVASVCDEPLTVAQVSR